LAGSGALRAAVVASLAGLLVAAGAETGGGRPLWKRRGNVKVGFRNSDEIRDSFGFPSAAADASVATDDASVDAVPGSVPGCSRGTTTRGNRPA